ncbi:hypothetical protein ASPWEDRAFT_163838 [Aspergillus wentii DTO 134E9]|uniref:Uncharacterized protein n=1 Tax=Aspergillus wentii DTO 134E9 TaxID=1073089 RepID=A0A1L9R9Q1_ASPWE|nr:uncharacterized protein ASPWEDRAFT_163838 [Aspergillus wentii DTO 134E9]KAI9926325.1 hypothetical protein MW887_004089 [Aspergillus wentii]OJJ31644.1 hypothetical protein ASPWEDRAFT_163838 [Aspergillus wentii DTO 134E9]
MSWGVKLNRLQHLWLQRFAPQHARALPSRPGWRPFALRPPYLFFITGFFFLMLLALEAMRRYSSYNGGLVFFFDTANVSPAESFAYNYVPIIVALVLVNLWTFIDFDVLRLEPYFQLSRSKGTPAATLFINYNFGQSFLTPITSARRGHWIVLLVSIVTMFIRMFLPALQSTLLELREVTIVSSESVKSWPDLVNLRTQASWIAAQAYNNLDSVIATGDDARRSRSSEFAVAPVEVSQDDQRESTVWAMNQTVYWSELSCQDILLEDKLSVTINETGVDYPFISWNVTDINLDNIDGVHKDCTLDFSYSSVFFPSTDFLQVRYWEPVSSSNRTSSPMKKAFKARGCDPFDLYGVLIGVNATSQSSSSKPEYSSSAQAFACNIAYRKADAEVVMHANSSINSIKTHPGTTSNMTYSQFNIAQFQSLLSQRAPYTSDLLFIQYNESTGDRSVTELPVISQDIGDFEPLLVLDTSSTMTQSEFQSKITRGVKQSFILTFTRLFNPDKEPTSIDAMRFNKQVAIAVVSFAALWSEVILGIATATGLVLVYVYQNRENMMQSDPGSLSAMCTFVSELLTPTNILTRTDYDFHQFSTRQLRRTFRNARCYWQDGPQGRKLEIVPGDGERMDIGENLRTRVDPMPHFLVIPFFIVEFLLLVAVITSMGLIIASLVKDGKFRHLTQSDSSFLQVVLSFLPSMVASSVGSLCQSIHRNLSILEPWVHLQRGKAKAQASLSMNYASQTPLAVLLKSVKDRHVLLGLVSLTCMLNFVLTVVAGGLFTQQLTTSPFSSTSVLSNYSNSVFLQTDFAAEFTEYDLIQTGITSGVPILPWMSSNYSFVPLKVDRPESDAAYGAQTLGIGSHLECRQLPIADSLVEEQGTGNTYWDYRPFDNPDRQCQVNMTSLKNKSEDITLSIHFLSPVADDQMDECQSSTVVVLGRWNYTAGSDITNDNTVALHCEPRIRMKLFSLVFDRQGQIKESDPVRDSSITSGSMYDNATVSLGQFNKAFAAIPQTFTGNDTTDNSSYISSYDWAGFLVARLYQRGHPEITSLDPAYLSNVSQTVYQWVYSTYFSLWRDIYLQPLVEPAQATNGTVIYNTWAMSPSIPSLAIALIIIGIDTLVVLLVFGTRRGRFKGPRIPRSIGAIIPWIAHSRMLEDFRGTYHWTSMQRRRHLAALNKLYGFRMFLGPDGRYRFAVDEEPPEEEKPPDPVDEGTVDVSKIGGIQLQELGRSTARE